MGKKNDPADKAVRTKLVATRIDVDLYKQLKVLSIKSDRAIYELISEACTDLLLKYPQR